MPHLGFSKNKGNNNTLQIVHLMGNHLRYSCRYPKEYTHFKLVELPQEERYKDLSNKQKQTIIDYVNSIYYNDYIVSSIIKRYTDDKSLVIYISDHGQVLFDDPQNPSRFGHGITRQALSVPMIFFISDKFRTAYPEIYNAIEEAKNKPFMLDLLTHSLTALLGIETRYHNPKVELFNKEYQENRPREISGLGKTIIF